MTASVLRMYNLALSGARHDPVSGLSCLICKQMSSQTPSSFGEFAEDVWLSRTSASHLPPLGWDMGVTMMWGPLLHNSDGNK